MQDERKIDLCKYRMGNSADSLKVAQDCLEKEYYKDAINRSYYAAFYAIKSVLALEGKDFKRHKDMIAYFNKTYVASREETTEQIENAKEIIAVIRGYLEKEGLLRDSMKLL